jgi:hypothetical protein
MKPLGVPGLLLLALLASPVAAALPPSPEAFLGFRVGADRKLADYEQIVRYFEALDQASERRRGALARPRRDEIYLWRDLGRPTCATPIVTARSPGACPTRAGWIRARRKR